MGRIQDIRSHKNYWALPRVDEFWNVVDMLSVIAATNPFTTMGEKYLERVEQELERLNPGKRLMVIEGEEEEVDTLYLGEADGKDSQ